MFLVSRLCKILTFTTVVGASVTVGILCRPLIDKGCSKDLFNPENPFKDLDLTKLKWSTPVNYHIIKKPEEPETINVTYEIIKSLPVFFG